MSRCKPIRQQAQRGAALLIMLVVMVIGIATILVGSLNSTALNNSRQQQTSAALAQAKDALIGRAATDANVPGSLPCPDTNDDGSAELMVGSNCPHYIGRLPWRTLGLTELRDGNNDHLWYALSSNFRDDSTAHIKSDTQGTLNITGTQTFNNVVAIIFSAGNPLSGQNRSPTQTALCTTTNSTLATSLCATNYLEGSNYNLSTAATPNNNYQTAMASSAFNDQMIVITHDQLMTVIEKRIAREAKNCLDVYAIASGGTYPWATPLTSTTLRPSMSGTYFGRFPDGKRLDPATPSSITDFINTLNAVQTALNNYAVAANGSNATALNTAGNALESAGQNPPNQINNTTASNAKNAGQQAENLAQGNGSTSITIVQSAIDATQAVLIANLSANGWLISDPYFNGCALLASTYWPDWDDLIFYQVARTFQLGGSKNCTGNCLALQISGNNATGSGGFRAMVISAGEKLGATRNPTNAADYLEAPNLLPQNNAASPYKNYRLGDPTYQTVNDLSLCVDGKVNCK